MTEDAEKQGSSNAGSKGEWLVGQFRYRFEFSPDCGIMRGVAKKTKKSAKRKHGPIPARTPCGLSNKPRSRNHSSRNREIWPLQFGVHE